MLDTSRLFSSFAVDDIEAARAFYRDTLGLEVKDGQQPGIIELHGAGHDAITVYPKADHQPATFTVLNFVVDDVGRVAASLRTKGVAMEQYHTPDIDTDVDGVATGGGMQIAWFRDPAGNILSVIAEHR
jgi:catechol 2,3-dioxygenase-like lactoylglutathione lyase family enzyme